MPPETSDAADHQQEEVDPDGRGGQQEVGWDDNLQGAHIIILGRLEEEGLDLEQVGAGRQVAVGGLTLLARIAPFRLVA